MILEYVLIFLICILNYSSTGIVPTKNGKACQKLNVVLFFAKTSYNLPQEAAGMKALEMHEVARVKSSFPKPHNNDASCNIIPIPPCKDLLRETLTSLVHFCQNALGMKTAIVSISNSEITNDLNNAELETPQENRERHFSQNVPFDIFQTDANKQDIKPLFQQQMLPKPEVVKLRDVITSPEHTEVFKIRVKRQLPGMENKPLREIVDVPLVKENRKPSWDVLDIMSHIRFSFFGKLFEDDAKKKLNDEENKIADDLTESKMDPGLFETVKTTLSTLQENSEEPLFMTVFGGHLSEISDCKSPMVQSIKHVIENTDPTNTLLVLTGSCPDHEGASGHNYKLQQFGQENAPRDIRQLRHEGQIGHEQYLRGRRYERQHQRKRQNRREEIVVNIDENNNRHHENETFPVFARGPEYIKLSQCSLLFDIPVVVKNILEQLAPTFEGDRRSKRSIFGDIRVNKDNYKNVANQINKYQRLIFNLCVFILLVL